MIPVTHSDSDYRLDELDRRILHALMDDGRNTTAASIADAAGVSGATVRNRIRNLEDELFEPSDPFNPDETVSTPDLNDFISLTGDSNVVEVTVGSAAPIVGLSLEEATRQDVISDGVLVIGIERDDTELTPKGDTVVEPDDILTVLSRSDADLESLDPFQGPEQRTTTDR